MVKPDGVSRGLVSDITARFEKKGYKLIAAKLMMATKAILTEHYGHLVNKPFFPSLIDFMTSGPVFCMVWEGKGAVNAGRVILGATNPLDCAPGTVRGDFAIDIGRNVCHGSDSVESAEKEIANWFPEGVISYERAIHSCLYE